MRLRSLLAPSVVIAAVGASVAVATPPVTVVNTSLDLNNWTQPQGVALSADGTRAYTANYYGGAVSVVDTASGALLDPVYIGADHLNDVVVNHAGTRAYVSTWGGNVWTLDLTGTSPTVLGGPIDVRQGRSNVELRSLAISPDDATLYVAEVNAGTRVAKIALGTGTFTETDPLVGAGAYMLGLAISPDGADLFVGTWNGVVERVRTADLQVTTTAVVPNLNIEDVAVDATGAHLYAVGQGSCGAEDGCLAVLDAPSLTGRRMISLGTTARSLALSPDGATAYVGLVDGRLVATPSDGSGTPGAPVVLTSGATHPSEIAVNAEGSAIYVASYRDAPDGCTQPIDDTSILTTCHQGALTSITFPAPGAPTDLVATSGDGSAIVAFTPGDAHGTTATNTEYSVDRGPWTAASPATTAGPVTIGGLDNGRTYSVRLRTRSGSVAGTASNAVEVTPAAPAPAPAAPTEQAPASAVTPPATSARTQPVYPPMPPPLVPPRLAPGTSTYVTVGLVPDGAASVVQLASTGASGAARQSFARSAALARMHAPCPISTDGATRTYRCSLHLGGGNWTVTTRAMNGSTVVAQSVRHVRVKARVRRAVAG